jgi:hypothetical protein
MSYLLLSLVDVLVHDHNRCVYRSSGGVWVRAVCPLGMDIRTGDVRRAVSTMQPPPLPLY